MNPRELNEIVNAGDADAGDASDAGDDVDVDADGDAGDAGDLNNNQEIDTEALQTNEWLLRRFNHKEVQLITKTPVNNTLSISHFNKTSIYKFIDYILYSSEQHDHYSEIYAKCQRECEMARVPYSRIADQYYAQVRNRQPVNEEWKIIVDNYNKKCSERTKTREDSHKWAKIIMNFNSCLRHNTEILFKYDYSLACMLQTMVNRYRSIVVCPTIKHESELKQYSEQAGELGKFIIDHYGKIFTAINQIIIKKHGIKLTQRTKKSVLLHDCMADTGSRNLDMVNKLRQRVCASIANDRDDMPDDVPDSYNMIIDYIDNIFNIQSSIIKNAKIKKTAKNAKNTATAKAEDTQKSINASTTRLIDAIVDLYNVFEEQGIPHYTLKNIKTYSKQFIYREQTWRRRRYVFKY